jgi:spore maturation protein A
LSFLFSDIPKNHESLGLISSNMIANLFGLGNAATPFGIKAMKSLQTLNDKKDTATRSMITFLIINTSGLSLIPTTVISLRLMHGSNNPLEIVGAVIVASLASLIFGLILDKIFGRRFK